MVKIIFVVAMFLWLLGGFYVGAPANQQYVATGRNIVAWISVLMLYFIVIGLHF